MPDVFDQVASARPAPAGDVFDQAAARQAAPAGDVFDRVAPDLSQLRISPDRNLVSTIAGGTRGAFLGGGFTPADLPDKADAQEVLADLSRPAVALPRFTVNPDDSRTAAALKTAANMGISLPEFAESPLGVASLAAGTVAPRAVAGAFLGDTARGVGQQATQMGEQWDSMTPAQRSAAITELGGQTALAATLGHAAIKPGGPAVELARQLDSAQPEAPTGALPTPTVEQAPEWAKVRPDMATADDMVAAPESASPVKVRSTEVESSASPRPDVETAKGDVFDEAAAKMARPSGNSGELPTETPANASETPNSSPAEIPLLPVDVTDSQVQAMRSPAAERPPDILDTIGDHFPNGVKFGSVADYGDYVKSARGAAKDLMSHTDGEDADKVLDGLHLAGAGHDLETVDDLAQAMVDAGETRIGQRGQGLEEARALAETKARDEAFADANSPREDATEPMRPEQMFIGDTVKFDGQPMRVTGFGTDAETGAPTGVELEGAYGRQTVPVGRTLHIDKDSLQPETLPPGRVAASGTSAPRPGRVDKNQPTGESNADETAVRTTAEQGSATPNASLAAAAAAYLQRSGEVRQGNRGGADEIDRQSEQLATWAKAQKAVIPALDFGQKLGAGMEHEVFVPPGGDRVIKRTYPGSFGTTPDAKGAQTAATPSAYLDRIDLMNRVFGSDIRLEGVQMGDSPIIGKGKQPALVTSQPLVRPADMDRPHPTPQQIEKFMRQEGFTPTPKSYFGWERADGVKVVDARPDNYILSKEGVVPVDLVVRQDKTVAPGRVAAAGTSAPRTAAKARPTQVPPQIASTPAPSVGPLRAWFGNQVTGFKSIFAPQSLSPAARGIGNALRHFMGENALALARADEAMKPWHKEFDKTPVPADWRYNPAEPLPHNYAIVDALERDPASLPQRYQDLAKVFKAEFDWRIKEIQKYAPNALQHLIANYFPHLWEDPKRAGDAMMQASTRLFAGRKEFLKQRTLPMFRDGLERGLKPISDNPVDLLMAKMHSMDKFLLALKFADEAKATGAMKFKYALEKMPDGFQKIDDPAFTVNAPPTVTLKEAFDAQLRTRTQELLQKLGVPNSRLATLGGKRWGMAYERPEQIKTRFAGPMSVYWHELGHILDYRYNLQDSILKKNKNFDQELRNLADRRLPAGMAKTRAVLNKSTGKVENRPASQVKYVRSGPEKMAVMTEAYVHAPEVFQRVAPTVYKAFDQFIDAHPELEDIRNIKPSLRVDTGTMEQKLPGVLKLGDWAMPDGPAQVLKNYLSPGMSQFAAFRSFKSASNILNAAQLGLSGFHLGFTSLDAATSRLAIGLEDLSKGHVYKAGKTFASVPASPVTNIMQGSRMMREALHPGSTDAETAQLVRALEQAGGRIGQDKFWQTDFLRRLKRAWNEGTATGYLKTIPLAPLTAIEQAMRPIMEYVVPRQKLGVFADMARRQLEQLGPNASLSDTREAMRKAWDSVDNRMGQVVYDNLFYNRIVKDLALMSFRAYGWQLGKYREGLGALGDTAAAGKALIQGKRPELSHRMAYAMALPMMVGTIGATMNYLMTGQAPQDWRDYFMPRTGKMDTQGNAARVNLPTYMKDVLAYAKHPIEAVGHSLNPMFSSITDLLNNKDFYDVQIRNPDDPLWRQGSDVAKFAAKQFTPFSVSGTVKLHEQRSPLQQEVLPFFGVTPVPTRMTMSPAQELAAEITSANFPAAPRTQEQFDKSKLVREIVQDFRDNQNKAANDALAQGFKTGMLHARDTATILDKVKYTPLEFQVHHMDIPAAMRVWRVARPDERTQLAPMIQLKLQTTRTLTPDAVQQYSDELSRAR